MLDFDKVTPSIMLCCLCGCEISANPANMCVTCIRSQVDITDGIGKQITIFWCKGRGRWLQPPNYWMVAELESNELLSFCIKRVRGLNKVKLIDASWIWTEPHSKRLKVKFKVQKEVFQGTILEQVFQIEYVVQNLFCDSCHKVEAKDTWVAVCQVRQHVNHKRTFLYLEQMILKYKAHTHCISIKEQTDGLDFFFGLQNQCLKFLNFIQTILPIRWKEAKKLVGADKTTQKDVYTFNYSVEIPPISRDELICLPPKICSSHGGISPLLICTKIANTLHFRDPFSLNEYIFSNEEYWTYEFVASATRNSLQEFIILDIEETGEKGSKKTSLAEATVAKASDLGRNDVKYHTYTYLGAHLNCGDSVAGYDITTFNFSEHNFRFLKEQRIRSEIIFVKKMYPNRRRIRGQRHWKLAKLDIEEIEEKKTSSGQKELQREEFMKDLEEDPEMRSQFDLYREPGVNAPTHDPDGDMDDIEPDFPEVSVNELIEAVSELTI